MEPPRRKHEHGLEQLSRQVILKHRLGKPVQVKDGDARYRKYRIHLSRRIPEQVEVNIAPGYKVHCLEDGGAKVYDPLTVGCNLYLKTSFAGWLLSEVIVAMQDS